IDALRKRFPKIVGPRKDDICYATTNRQEAVRALAEQADVVLVTAEEESGKVVAISTNYSAQPVEADYQYHSDYEERLPSGT
ncbi:hypothetical protein MJN47_32545, partial [Salmonella enterica subsp. enterica serovar Lubbock]|nr:hypothetical protein [Salmonella enterica subsp. enterica serovar Lubbock]